MTLTLLTLAMLNAAAQDASLSGTEFHHRGLLLSQNDVPPPPPPPPLEGAPMPGNSYDSWSLEQLQRESMRLSSMRPGLAGPIVLLSVGAGLAVMLGLPLTLAALTSSAGGFAFGVLAGGLVFLLPGIAMVIAGFVWLASRISERREYDQQLEEIDLYIRNRETQMQMQPVNVSPSVDLLAPAPRQVVLARF